MLHSGHVAFLEEAARLGDLYVGLGSDAAILELKGRRTINSNAERLYIVKALRQECRIPRTGSNFAADGWISPQSILFVLDP